MSYKFTIIIQKEENWYTAKCAENNVTSQGKTIEEAVENLKEAVELYYEDNTESVMIYPTFISTMEVNI